MALAIASLLAITGSLGLHPEPERIWAAATPEGFASSHGAQPGDGVAHDCLACLAHRSVPLPRLAGVVLTPGAAVSFLFLPRPGQPLTTDARTYEGRAPPILT